MGLRGRSFIQALADAARRLYNDSELAIEVGQKYALFAEKNFDQHKVLKGYASFLEKVNITEGYQKCTGKEDIFIVS